eukprot:gene9202-1302_t
MFIPNRLRAFGFLACRWGWKNKAYIDDVLKTFRNGSFPADAFISDFEWFTDRNDYGIGAGGDASYHDFGWNPTNFPSPKEQLAEYHKMGFRFGGIRKPRLGGKADLDEVKAHGWTLPGGVNARGRNLNFSASGLRDWYTAKNEHYNDEGVDFWWNDEGEVHYFQYDGWNDAQNKAWAKSQPNKRFFTLNRAYTPGLQRFGLAVWTGDVGVNWGSLAQQPEYLLNYMLAGSPYTGAFLPVMRVHSTQNDEPHFPWLYGDAAAASMRKSLELRYRMVPMWYSLAHATYATGAPLTRALFMDFGDDKTAAATTDQWLVGSGAAWYDFGAATTHAGGAAESVTVALDEVPVYCRAGAVVPLAP